MTLRREFLWRNWHSLKGESQLYFLLGPIIFFCMTLLSNKLQLILEDKLITYFKESVLFPFLELHLPAVPALDLM